MKLKKTLLLLLLAVPVMAFAQQDASKPFLFDEFEKGKVVYKNGKTFEAMFNYNTTEGVMLFLSNNESMQIDNVAEISNITIGDRCFVTAPGDLFLERIKAGNNNYFYVHWKTRFFSQGAEGAYGTRSSATAVSSVSTVATPGSLHKLNTKDAYECTSLNSYYLKIGDSFKRFVNLKSLQKLFKGHEQAIKEFADTQKIDFEKFADVQKLMDFCSQFLS